MRKLYFPVTVDQGVALLRRQRSLEQTLSTPQHTVIGYSDRAVAVLESRKGCCDHDEVGLLKVSFTEELFHQMLNGDWVHFGPCAHWIAEHTLELEPGASGRFVHEAHYSLEIVKR